MSPRKAHQVLASVVLLLVSTTLALAVAEYVLRAQRAAIESSSEMDPGLLRYDAYVGWMLKPLWRGRHRHHDFDVRYSTGIDAWRSSPAAEGKVPGRDVYWVGDSFTFGFGVSDAEAFVNRLNQREAGGRHVNAGIPGVSTDQEMLLIERRVLPSHPGKVALLVYLGNDLFDNRLPFPLQADNAKPYFTLDANGELEAHQIPVPHLRKPTDGRQPSLSQIVLGATSSGIWAGLLDLEIVRRLGWGSAPTEDWRNTIATRFEDDLTLFMALLTRIQRRVTEAGAQFRVYLLPSRRAVEQPDGVMAQVQDYLAAQILARSRIQGASVIDLTPVLRAAQRAEPGALYFPNEGHLTAQGHAVVAEALSAAP